MNNIQSRSDRKVGRARIGIGLPVYNGAQYLEETLASVLGQTCDDFDLIISDNASTDRTEEICRDYAARDSRIHYLRHAVNLGASRNYTACFQPSEHELFRWQNADDPIERNLLELCVKTLDENPAAVLVYGKTKIIDQHGDLVKLYDDRLDLREDSGYERFTRCLGSIGLSNVLYGLMRRESLAKTALLESYIASDINLIAELTLYGQFHEIPEYLFSRRMHTEASSWDRSDTEGQKTFWDPSKRKLVLQTWRSVYAYFSAVARAPLSIKEKKQLFFFLSKIAYWEKAPMASEAIDWIKYRLIRR